jgi:hypothetical protein
MSNIKSNVDAVRKLLQQNQLKVYSDYRAELEEQIFRSFALPSSVVANAVQSAATGAQQAPQGLARPFVDVPTLKYGIQRVYEGDTVLRPGEAYIEKTNKSGMRFWRASGGLTLKCPADLEALIDDFIARGSVIHEIKLNHTDFKLLEGCVSSMNMASTPQSTLPPFSTTASSPAPGFSTNRLILTSGTVVEENASTPDNEANFGAYYWCLAFGEDLTTEAGIEGVISSFITHCHAPPVTKVLISPANFHKLQASMSFLNTTSSAPPAPGPIAPISLAPFIPLDYVAELPKAAVCECGAAKIGIKPYTPGHSSWCPVKEATK